MKKILVPVLLVAVFLVGGALAYRAVFRADAQGATWIVSTYSGSVEVALGGADWRAVDMHQPLGNGDRIRTSSDGEVTLVHDASHVTVRSDTNIEVSQLNSDSSRFQVAEGQVYVEARGNRIAMRTQAGASMETSDAGVGMTVKPDGWTQVIVKRGEADFTSGDQTEHVTEGQSAHAEAGGAPSKPAPIPQVLLLNVRFPDADTFNSRLARVEGKADPGSRLEIDGQSVPVDDDGKWTAEVQLDEGINQIEVQASDSTGASRTETSQPIRVDTLAPGLDGATIGSRLVSSGGSSPGGASGGSSPGGSTGGSSLVTTDAPSGVASSEPSSDGATQ